MATQNTLYLDSLIRSSEDDETDNRIPLVEALVVRDIVDLADDVWQHRLSIVSLIDSVALLTAAPIEKIRAYAMVPIHVSHRLEKRDEREFIPCPSRADLQQLLEHLPEEYDDIHVIEQGIYRTVEICPSEDPLEKLIVGCRLLNDQKMHYPKTTRKTILHHHTQGPILLVNLIEALCEEVLISEKGTINYANLKVLEREAPVKHRVLEQDSLGPMRCGLELPFGVVVYG